MARTVNLPREVDQTYYILPGPIYQLLIQLHQAEPVLRLASLDVHFPEELADHCNEGLLVRVILWRVLVERFE